MALAKKEAREVEALPRSVLWPLQGGVRAMRYDDFLGLLRYRRSIRRFKPDPIPDDYVMKILDAAHTQCLGLTPSRGSLLS